MTLRHLLKNLTLYAACFAVGGLDAAAGAADGVVRAAIGIESLDPHWMRSLVDRVPLDCACLSHRRTPVAPACAND